MTGRITKFLTTPVIVDESFLRSLDNTLHELDADLVNLATSEREISAPKLLQYRDGKISPRKLSNRYEYESALNYISSKYTITWDDDLKLENVSLDECLRALNSESASPTQIDASIGKYGSLFASVSLRNKLFNLTFVNLVGPVGDIRNILLSLKSNIYNSSPDVRFLHHGYFKLLLFFIMFLFAVVVLSIIGYKWLSQTPNELADDLGSFALLPMLLGGAIGGYAPKLYADAFPGVAFEFGRGTRYRFKKKFIFGIAVIVLSAILIPSLIGD